MSTKIRLIFASLLALGLAGTGPGQRAKLSGYVYENGIPKARVMIMVVGAQEQATDVNGHFRIMLPNEHFTPGQPITIRVNSWKVFDPIFGQSAAQDASFDAASITVSIIRPRSTLAHLDRKRLGVIVAAFQKENRNLSNIVFDLQSRLAQRTDSLGALSEEADRLREENEKHAFMRKYAEEYEIPLDTIERVLDEWARNKKADDDLEAARKASWRGDYAQVIEFTKRAEMDKDDLAQRNQQEGRKLNRERLELHVLKVSALIAQRDVNGFYDAAKRIDSLFESRSIPKEDFPDEWAENKLLVAAAALFKQALSDLDKPTVTNPAQAELIVESVRALRSVEGYFTPKRSPGVWVMTKFYSVMIYQYQNLLESQDTKFIHEMMGSMNEVLSASDAKGKVITPERFPEEWSLIQGVRGILFTGLSTRTTGTDSLKYLQAAINVQKEILAAGSPGAKVFTPEKYPIHWARAQALLASSLLDLSRRTQGAESLIHLKEAIAAYKALFATSKPNASYPFGNWMKAGGPPKVYTPEEFPQEWAQAQGAMGSALLELSRRITGPESIIALSEAVAAYRAAADARKSDIDNRRIRFVSYEETLRGWAEAQSWLSSCLIELSRRTAGLESLTHLIGAIAASRAVLDASDGGEKPFTAERLTGSWAWAQINLGTALVDLSYRAPAAERIGHVHAAIEAAKAVLSANKAGARIVTPEAFPNEWVSAQFTLAGGHSALNAWDMTRDVYVEVLRHFPDNQMAHLTLSRVYSEKLFMFERAFDLHEQWLVRHPDDVEAQVGFATAHFKTGRFTECARRLKLLLGRPDLPANTTIGLRTIEIANLIALNRQNEVPEKLDALIREVSGQPTSFILPWSFDGAKNYIDRLEHVKPQRVWLHQLLDAFQSTDRGALLETLRKLQADWKINPRAGARYPKDSPDLIHQFKPSVPPTLPASINILTRR